MESLRSSWPLESRLVSKAEGSTMKRWASIFGVAGALWMILVLQSGSLALATFSNYPGTLAVTWVQYRGIAPSPALIWTFNVVLTSAVEWTAVGLTLRAVLQRLSK
jgi:hypothetical protein